MEQKSFLQGYLRVVQQPPFNNFVLVNRKYEIFFTTEIAGKGCLCLKYTEKIQMK